MTSRSAGGGWLEALKQARESPGACTMGSVWPRENPAGKPGNKGTEMSRFTSIRRARLGSAGVELQRGGAVAVDGQGRSLPRAGLLVAAEVRGRRARADQVLGVGGVEPGTVDDAHDHRGILVQPFECLEQFTERQGFIEWFSLPPGLLVLLRRLAPACSCWWSWLLLG